MKKEKGDVVEDILKIEPEHYGERVDLVLREIYPEVSRSYIQKLIKNKCIVFNDTGKKLKQSHILEEGDVLKVVFPKSEEIQILPEEIPLEVIYEDDHIVLINKPKGMVVHPAPGNYEHTLVNALLFKYGDNLSDRNGLLRPGIVHRIDKDTSGVIVVCKTNEAYDILSEKFKVHDIYREYHFLSFGYIKDDKFDVDVYMGRNPSDRLKMAVLEEGVRSITHFEVIERFSNYTYGKATLETGKTHQIRVHLSYKGHQIVGDQLYGHRKNEFGVKGQMLHAKVLGFVHPITEKYMEFSSELPSDFKKALNRLRHRQR